MPFEDRDAKIIPGFRNTIEKESVRENSKEHIGTFVA
jgi:hypothetical protein